MGSYSGTNTGLNGLTGTLNLIPGWGINPKTEGVGARLRLAEENPTTEAPTKLLSRLFLLKA